MGVHPAGDERSTHRGPGAEYADVREYQGSEDARLIDWNLTARSDRAFVRESHPERGIDVWLLVDASASLDWGTTRALKRNAAQDVVDLVTLLLSRHGNRVGAMVFDTEVRRIFGLTAGRQARLGLVARLGTEGTRPAAPGRTQLGATLARAGRVIRRPSVLVVISDFLVDDGWQKAMKTLAIRHDVVAARISDPREGDIPNVGIVTFEDPETGAQVEVDTTSRKFRQRYRAAAAEQRSRLLADFKEARVRVLEVTTAEPVSDQLVAFLRGRQRRRGAPLRLAR